MVSQDSFRLTELGNLLLQYHKPFREEYQGSNIPKSYRLHSKRTYIENKIDELIQLNLIGSKGVQSIKNNTSTKEYFFSNIGTLFSCIIIGKIEKDEIMRTSLIIDFFFELSDTLKSYQNSLNGFLIRVIKDVLNNDNPDLLEDLFSYFSSIFPIFITALIKGEFHLVRLILLITLTNHKEISVIFFDSLRNLNENIRKLILLQIKLDIESGFNWSMEMMGVKPESVARYRIGKLSGPIEWEKLRYKNISNYNVVTLFGFCIKYNKFYPFIYNTLEFIQLPNILKAVVGNEKWYVYIKDQFINCFKCNKENSLKIYQLWLRRGYFLPILGNNMEWKLLGIENDILK